MDSAKFGAFLIDLRKEKGLTQEQLAERLNVTNRTVSRWETGVNIPDIDILIILADFYDIDIREMLDGERKTLDVDTEETEVLLKAAEYSTMKENNLIRKVFAVVISGVVAIGVLFLVIFWFLGDVINGSVVVFLVIISFLIYSICMQAFPESRNTYGYLAALTSGFLAVIASSILILLLFFESGTYHNYGIVGAYFALGVDIFSFLTTGIATRMITKRHRMVK